MENTIATSFLGLLMLGAGAVSASAQYACTHVIGFSQTRQWYLDAGVFEDYVGDDRWQLVVESSGGIEKWADLSYSGWKNRILSPCVRNSANPDRVVLTISGRLDRDVRAWVETIRRTIGTVRTRYPSVQEIVLQPLVGDHFSPRCRNVKASMKHRYIDQAIQEVISTPGIFDVPVVAGISPEVRTCGDYGDASGHLTGEGAVEAARKIGEYYATTPSTSLSSTPPENKLEAAREIAASIPNRALEAKAAIIASGQSVPAAIEALDAAIAAGMEAVKAIDAAEDAE